MNYERFLTSIAKSRQVSPIREFTKYLVNPSPTLINMTAGYPNAEKFPFKSAEIRLKNGTSFSLHENLMKTALQYSSTQGLPKLLNWLRELQCTVHKPSTSHFPSDDNRSMEILVTPGSQDGIMKAMECLLSPGDSILLEEPSYPGTLAFMIPQGYNCIGVKGDGDGIIPASLLEKLNRWTPHECRSTISKDIPRVLYVIPTAGNPTGTTISTERKKEIYKIAQDYDLMIIEDDPYFYLHFDKHPPHSFLSLDVDGRVIRTDSFSKILSSGMRLGFVTGPKAVMQPILMHMQVTIVHTSGISQLIMQEILDQWGIHEFMDHVSEVQKFYKDRRDLTMKYANKWLKGLAEWNVPAGGMFLWLTIPALKDTTNLCKENLIEKELLVIPGNVFMPDRDAPSQNLRISFSMVKEDHIDEGFQRLAEGIKAEIAKQQQ